MRENYSSFEFNKYNIDKVIIPIGSYEQHGTHATLATDYLIADEIARRLSERSGIYKLPPIAFGCSALHLGHRGTISIKEESFKSYLSDIIESLIDSKVKTVFVVNGHGGNIRSINAVRNIYSNRITIMVLSWWIIGRELQLFRDDETHHAGSLETSVLLAIDEKYVNKDLYIDNKIIEYDPYNVKFIDDITPTGSIGIVTTASKKRGQVYLDKLVDYIIENYIMLECSMQVTDDSHTG